MPAPKKYDADWQERAGWMYRDRLDEYGGSRGAAVALFRPGSATIRWIERDETAHARGGFRIRKPRGSGTRSTSEPPNCAEPMRC